MLDNGFIQIYRTLLHHPKILSLNDRHFRMFIILLYNLRFESKSFNDHGKEIIVQIGQLMTTCRDFVETCKNDGCKTTKSDVSRFFKYLHDSQIVGQSLGRKKTLLALSETYIVKKSGTNSGTILGQSWDNLGTEKNNVNKGNKGNNEINVDEWEFLDSFDSAKLKDKDKDDLRKLDRNRVRQAIGWVCEQKKIRKTFIAAVIHAYNTEQTPENESSIPLGVPELKKFIDKINKRLEKRGIKERCDLNCETATIVMADMKRIGEKMGYVAHTHQIPISELRLLSTRKRIEENIKLLHRS